MLLLRSHTTRNWWQGVRAQTSATPRSVHSDHAVGAWPGPLHAPPLPPFPSLEFIYYFYRRGRALARTQVAQDTNLTDGGEYPWLCGHKQVLRLKCLCECLVGGRRHVHCDQESNVVCSGGLALSRTEVSADCSFISPSCQAGGSWRAEAVSPRPLSSWLLALCLARSVWSVNISRNGGIHEWMVLEDNGKPTCLSPSLTMAPWARTARSRHLSQDSHVKCRA